jgi:transposase InsO family protein
VGRRLEDEPALFAQVRLENFPSARDDPLLKELLEDAASNHSYNQVVAALRSDTHPRDLPQDHPAREFQSVWSDLGLLDDGEFTLIVKDHKLIVVPDTMIARTLRKINRPHLGPGRTTLYARERYYWSGMSRDVKAMCENCVTCIKFSPSQPSLPMKLEVRRTENMAPLSDCGTDLWQLGGKDFLVLVDRFSGFILCRQVPNKTSSAVIEQLTQWQLDYHPITRLRSDGGPAFKSAEFAEFCEEFGIVHELSSANNAESDGMAEAGVNVCKRLQKKSVEDGTNFQENLQSLNNFPRKAPAGMPPIASPAEMFFSTGQREYNPLLGSNEPDLAMSAMSREKQRAIMRKNSHRKNSAMMPLIRNDLV